MSCGNPHAIACASIRSLMYVFIDGELDAIHQVDVTTHLAECAPCEIQFAAELSIKSMVRRSCVHDVAPAHLRAAIIARIEAQAPPVE